MGRCDFTPATSVCWIVANACSQLQWRPVTQYNSGQRRLGSWFNVQCHCLPHVNHVFIFNALACALRFSPHCVEVQALFSCFGCCSTIAPASVAASQLRHFSCCSLPDCVHFSYCSPVASACDDVHSSTKDSEYEGYTSLAQSCPNSMTQAHTHYDK